MSATETTVPRTLFQRVSGRALVLAAQARGLQLDRASERPAEAQARALRALVSRAAPTAFGRTHDFARIRSVADFQARVPLRRYADLDPWFARARSGEPDVVWPGRIPYFGMSSGTTAGNKYIPISHDSVRQQQRGGFDPLAAYLRWTRDAALMDGVALMLGGSSRLDWLLSGALVGDNTGIMANHMPRFVEPRYRPRRETRRIADWDRKIDAVVRETLREDVRLVAGTPSWFPGLFDRLLEVAREAGIGAAAVRDVWPNLRLLTGGGINYEPYRPLIEARLGRSVPYVDVYNATEGGIMGVQDRADDRAMRLIPDNGVFYEFVPFEELDAPRPRRFTLDEIETGVTYALLVSTMSGLFSYAIGDCLRFVGRFPHRFYFEGRTAGFLNVTGEHVSQGELERALRRTAETLAIEVANFTVSADVGLPGGGAQHVWVLELGRAQSFDTARCAALLDDDVRAANGDYDAHRSSPLGLRAPLVRTVPAGTFHAFMKARGKLGGQHKVPRVTLGETRTLLDSCAAALDVTSHGAHAE